jgi:hypothetical protein
MENKLLNKNEILWSQKIGIYYITIYYNTICHREII